MRDFIQMRRRNYLGKDKLSGRCRRRLSHKYTHKSNMSFA